MENITKGIVTVYANVDGVPSLKRLVNLVKETILYYNVMHRDEIKNGQAICLEHQSDCAMVCKNGQTRSSGINFCARTSEDFCNIVDSFGTLFRDARKYFGESQECIDFVENMDWTIEWEYKGRNDKTETVFHSVQEIHHPKGMCLEEFSKNPVDDRFYEEKRCCAFSVCHYGLSTMDDYLQEEYGCENPGFMYSQENDREIWTDLELTTRGYMQWEKFTQKEAMIDLMKMSKNYKLCCVRVHYEDELLNEIAYEEKHGKSQPRLKATNIKWDIDDDELLSEINISDPQELNEMFAKYDFPYDFCDYCESKGEILYCECEGEILQILHNNSSLRNELMHLPDEIVIPSYMADDEDRISDYITWKSGYCHDGFDLEEVKTEQEPITPEVKVAASIYVVEAYDDECMCVVGYASSREKAERMIEMHKNISDEYEQYRFYKAPLDFVEINDVPIAV